VYVSICWLVDHPKAYQALLMFCASQEFIAKSTRARQWKGTFGAGHTYGPDGHLRLSKCMVRRNMYENTFIVYLCY
jgi:hypothetical protein